MSRETEMVLRSVFGLLVDVFIVNGDGDPVRGRMKEANDVGLVIVTGSKASFIPWTSVEHLRWEPIEGTEEVPK